MRVVIAGLLLILALAVQAGETVDAGEAGSGLSEEIRREENDRVRRTIGLWGAGYSWPLEVYASVSFLFTKLPSSFDCATTCKFRGLLLQVEPALEGGRLNLGYAVVIGETGKNRTFLSKTYLAYGINASLLRTWGGSSLDPPEQTFAGLEGVFTITNVNFSLGVYRHVAGGDPDDRWLVTLALGYGF